MSRRGFLGSVGTGAIGVAAVAKLGAAEQAPAPAPPDTVPAGDVGTIALTVNGRRHKLLVEARWSLLYVLRERLGLSGAKAGCERGECGACTVLVDGTARYACMTLAAEVDGREITTVEGLMQGEELGTTQKAFAEEDAFQCGFCTPGQVMAAEALLRANPSPRHRRDPAGHVGQPLPVRRLRAHLQGGRQGRGPEAAGGEPMQPADTYYWEGPLPETDQPSSAPEPWGETKVVGKPLTRVDAYDRVSGSAVYPSDVTLPDMLHVAVLTCPHAHAIVTRVDTSKAEALPGVRAVLKDGSPGTDIPWFAISRASSPRGCSIPTAATREKRWPRSRPTRSTRRGTACARLPSTTTSSDNVVDVDDAMKAGAVAVRDEGNVIRAAAALRARRRRGRVRVGRRRRRARVPHAVRAAERDRAARVRGQVGRASPYGVGIDAGRLRRAGRDLRAH